VICIAVRSQDCLPRGSHHMQTRYRTVSTHPRGSHGCMMVRERHLASYSLFFASYVLRGKLMRESDRHCSPTSWQPSPSSGRLRNVTVHSLPLRYTGLAGLVALPPCSRERNRGRQSGDHAAIREFQQFGRSRYWRRRAPGERGFVRQHRLMMAWRNEDY